MIKKFLIFILVWILIFPLGLTAKDKQGAALLVEKKKGQWVRGELITVKDSSLLLLSESGADVSVNIKDISKIIVVKKSRAMMGAGFGFLTGGVIGGIVADSWEKSHNGWGFGYTYVPVFAFIGAFIGAGIGALVGTDKTIQIEGKTELEIKEAMEYLRSKARVPDYN